MKALTLTQPWASLVAIGEKRYETRDWQTRHRGLLAIHAGKNLKPVAGKRGLRRLTEYEPFHEALFGRGPYAVADDLPLGEVAAIVVLKDIVPTSQIGKHALQHGAAAHELEFGDYGPGRFAWALDDVLVVRERVPVRGHQSLWDWEEPKCKRCGGSGTIYMPPNRLMHPARPAEHRPCYECHGTGVGLKMTPLPEYRALLDSMVDSVG